MNCHCRLCWKTCIYPPPIHEKEAPRKLSKKSTAKKRKNKATTGLPLRLHNQENEQQMEGQSKNDGLEEPDKPRGKNKKNRNYSSPVKSAGEVLSSQHHKMVKIYSPLSLYIKLQLDAYELYHRFLPYVLDCDQLRENGFPLESLTDPGKAVFSCGRFQHTSSSGERICSRCYQKFTVSDDGKYESETICYYHSGKRLPIGEIHNAGAYACCGNPVSSNGCITGKQHVSAQVCLDNVDFVKTREKRQNPSYQIYALDCEMSYTINGLEITRISVVGTDGLAVYDSYVLPENPVIDYNTPFSGVTANHLKDVKTTLADVQAFLLKMLTASTILVGHALHNDLKALHLIHKSVVDTSVTFPNHQQQHTRKFSLKSLASTHLQKTIQEPCGHDSVEDARTCIELMLLKIQRDSHTYVNHQPRIGPLAIPPAQQWQSRPLSINPVLMPYNTYNVGYFVPPVGSSCDLY